MYLRKIVVDAAKGFRCVIVNTLLLLTRIRLRWFSRLSLSPWPSFQVEAVLADHLASPFCLKSLFPGC